MHCRTNFSDIEPLVTEDERYKTLLENQKDRVNDLYDAYMDVLKDELYADKKALRAYLKVWPVFFVCLVCPLNITVPYFVSAPNSIVILSVSYKLRNKPYYFNLSVCLNTFCMVRCLVLFVVVQQQ